MSDTFDELSARARRGELPRPEQQRLDTFLKASFEARVWHEAGRELDAEDSVRPGDHAAVERVMKRTLTALSSKPRRSRRKWVVLLVAAALFGVSAAAASVQGVRWWRAARGLVVSAPAAQPQAQAKTAPPVAQLAAPRRVDAVPVEVAAEAVTDAAATLVPSALVPVPAVTRASPANKTDSAGAAALFSEAALARREGNAERAIALLDSLQQRFPGSREARSSDMTLGSLHLQRGAAAAALEHFGRYLRAAPRGGLASEALWGEAQALAALGRRAEADARLRRLVERFPGSAYAAAARVKLELAAP
ncbi:MAG TPA: tetratricopeptide repeat protein [Polyangiaceae bacterium]|nr:tetratricopeptide repeat protein [Polyangiaceae bacterium]